MSNRPPQAHGNLDLPEAQVVWVNAGQRPAPVLSGQDRRIFSRAAQLDRARSISAGGRNVFEPRDVVLVHPGDDIAMAGRDVLELERVVLHVEQLECRRLGSRNGLHGRKNL